LGLGLWVVLVPGVLLRGTPGYIRMPLWGGGAAERANYFRRRVHHDGDRLERPVGAWVVEDGGSRGSASRHPGLH